MARRTRGQGPCAARMPPYKGFMQVIRASLLYLAIASGFSGAHASWETNRESCHPRAVSVLRDGAPDPSVDYFAGLHFANPDCQGYDPDRAATLLYRATAFDGTYYSATAFHRVLIDHPHVRSSDAPELEEAVLRIAAISILESTLEEVPRQSFRDLVHPDRQGAALRIFDSLRTQSPDERLAGLLRDRHTQPAFAGLGVTGCETFGTARLTQSTRFLCIQLYEEIARLSPYPVDPEDMARMARRKLYSPADEGYEPALVEGADRLLATKEENRFINAYKWISRMDNPSREAVGILEKLRQNLSPIERCLVAAPFFADGILPTLPEPPRNED